MKNLTIEHSVQFKQSARGRKHIVATSREPELPKPVGRLPRITKFMALAVRFELLLAEGDVSDYAELARLGYVTRPRITQIMNLRLLAPDIQEELLFLARIETGRAPVNLKQLQSITVEPDWKKQRTKWKTLWASLTK